MAVNEKNDMRMNKFLVSVGSIVLVLSIMSSIYAFVEPNQVDREIKVLNYQQTGTFNYQVFLKPSALYDGAPVSSFPAEIINNFDFSFTFTPTSNAGSSVAVWAVLSNPGIWEKRLYLASRTTASGVNSLPFSVDFDSLKNLLLSIEEELKITDPSRNVTIEATVATGGQTFIHKLEMEWTDTVAKVDNNLSQGQLAGQTAFDYTVVLKPNSVFDSSSLMPPVGNGSTIAPAGEPILLRLAQQMVADYQYSFSSDQPVANTATETQIVARLSAPDLWSKDFFLFSGLRSDEFTTGITLDLAAISNLIEAVRLESSVTSDKYNLEILSSTKLKTTTSFGPIEETFSSTMFGTITRNVLTWNQDLTETSDGAITQLMPMPNDQTYLGMSLGNFRTLSVSLVIFGITVLFAGFMTKSNKMRHALSKAEIESTSIHKKYGSRIVDALGNPPDEMPLVSLETIEGLITVADELGKPVMYFQRTAEQPKHIFCVLDENTCYQYMLDAS